MKSNINSSTNESLDVFNLESKKLELKINRFLKNSEELSIPEIIEMYYHVINLKSLSKFLKANFNDEKNQEETVILKKINEVEGFIGKEFDDSLHPQIMLNLKNFVENFMIKLKTSNSKNDTKAKENLEGRAEMYEKLRQIMSTKEFVDQYNLGLTN